MQIRHLKISNFRGIASLDWKPANSFCCLIGAGDSGKSTVLDAVEATLSARWFSFTESDFPNCEATQPILIEATIGELSRALKSDERFGLYIRGWTDGDDIRDEPEDDDEAVLTVRLTVDATMEPVWELFCDRLENTRTLSNRDRSLFGLIRLAGEDARHLAWGQGSVLSKLTGDTSEAASRLSEAYRAARASAHLDEIDALTVSAAQAEKFAKELGAYVEGKYGPGLELGRSGLSSGSIALHDGSVPLRLAGLGTRRLASLAIQKSAVTEGAIVLVDEIEHGLEPHRIIGAIAQLKTNQTDAKASSKPVGQIFMTTHSDVALGEAGAASLRVIQIAHPARSMSIASPTTPEKINALMRFTPGALFARRVLVTEGNTEIGILLGLRVNWPHLHSGKPIEQLGSAIADGNGGQTPSMALALASLGYSTAIFRDSDVALQDADKEKLIAASIPIFEYGASLNTEQAIFSAATDPLVQELLVYARGERGNDSVDSNLKKALDALDPLGGLTLAKIQDDFASWKSSSLLNSSQLRDAISGVAVGKKWFKDQRIGRGLGPFVWRVAQEAPASALAQTLARIEAWLYA